MKKTNFFKLLMVGAIALTVGLAGCNKGPSQEDFDKLCDRVSTLESSMTELQNKVNSLQYVVKVEKQADGNYLVTQSNGSTLVIEVGGGTTPPSGDDWLTIGDNGNWFINKNDTGEVAIATMPRITTNGDQRYWEFPVIDPATNDIVWKQGAKAIAQSYAVENPGGWVLWLPTKDDPSTLVPITITASSSGLGKIDILGWVEGYKGGNIATGDTDHDATADSSGDGDYEDGIYTNNTPLRRNIDDTFVVYYHWIDRFHQDTETRATELGEELPPLSSFWAAAHPTTGGAATGEPYGDWVAYTTGAAQPHVFYPNISDWGDDKGTGYEWHVNANPAENYGDIDVKRYAVLNTLDSQDKGLIIQVHPLTIAIANMNLKLEDSKGNVLPIEFKKPVLITGLLTRGDAKDSALYFLEGKGTSIPETYPGSTGRTDWASKFTPNALYSLVTPDGVRSEYTPFTFTPVQVISREGQVDKVGGEDMQPQFGVAPSQVASAYHVRKGKEVRLDFDPVFMLNSAGATIGATSLTTHQRETNGSAPFDPNGPTTNGVSTAGAGINSNAVVDYYMKVATNQEMPTWDEEFITRQFGITFNEAHTTFTIGRIPDNLTRAVFLMEVFKLGVDGVIYRENIRIHPTLEEIVTPINVGDYLIHDEWPTYRSSADAAAADYMSQKITVPLTEMWTELNKYVDDAGSTMTSRWQDNLYGAWTYTITNVTIEDQPAASNEGRGHLNRFMFPNLLVGTQANGTLASDGTPATGTQAGTYGVSAVGTLGDPTHIQAARKFAAADGGNKAAIAARQQGGATANNTQGAGSTAFIFRAANGSATNNLYDARSIDIFPNYAYDSNGAGADGNAPSFVRGKVHTFTINFYDRNEALLNTIKISFKPDIPVLTELFKKENEYWNEDQTMLNAYYAIPDWPWIGNKFYGSGTWSGGTRTAWPGILGMSDAAAPYEAVNSTFYNVYNPGGETDMVHTNTMPLDGGYTKVGLRSATDQKWVANTQVRLKAQDQKIDGNNNAGNYVKTTVSPAVNGRNLGWTPYIAGTTIWAQANVPYDFDFTAGTIVQLMNQTNSNIITANPDVTPVNGIPKADPNAYGEILNMTWNVGEYIDFYPYTDAEKAGNDFKMRFLSAMEHNGKVDVADGPAFVEAQGTTGAIAKLTDEHIALYNYAGNKHSVFKEIFSNQIGYRYTYIQEVYFSRPANVSVYHIMKLENGSYVQDNSGRTPAVDPVAATATDPAVEAYLPIRTNNTTFGSQTYIHVRVYDRFGRMVEGDVPFTIIQGDGE